MNKFLLAILLLFAKLALGRTVGLSLSFCDPLLGVAVTFAFFHRRNVKGILIYALFCGFLSDVFGLDIFAGYMLVYALCCLLSARASVILYRHDSTFLLAVVFLCGLCSHLIFLALRSLSSGPGQMFSLSRFLGRALLESSGTAILVYFLYRWSKRCACELTE